MQLPIAGHLSSFISNWEAITQDQWVLQSVHGYRIEFLQKPRQNHRPPQITFAKKEEECMQEEIQSMLDKQAITEIESCPEGFYSQMFLVPKKDGRQRPVINLKRLNQSVKTEHFKMEGIHMLKDLLKAGDWMAKIDLKDAYFMIPMAQEDREFLRFQWKDKAYQFNYLPFGLSSAPWVFTKTTRPVVATLRELGLRLIIYIDDILIVAETESLLRNHITAVIHLLENLGFVINYLQIRTFTNPSDRIPRVCCQLHKDGAQTTRRKDKENQERSRQNPAISHSISPHAVPHYCEDECSHSGHPHGPTILQEPPSVPPRGSTGGSELLLSNSTDRGSQRRTGMVDRPLSQVERSESDHPQLLPHNRDRCLDKRVGGSVQRSPHRGPVEPTGTDYAHKLPRAASSSPGSEMFCQEQNKSDYPSQDGQCVSTDIHQQTGGNNISTTELPSQRAMAVVQLIALHIEMGKEVDYFPYRSRNGITVPFSAPADPLSEE